MIGNALRGLATGMALLALTACEPPPTPPAEEATTLHSGTVQRDAPLPDKTRPVDEKTAPPTADTYPSLHNEPPPGPTTPRIAIIIDDLGNSRENGLRAIALPGAVTVSVLPDRPVSRELATAAQTAGKEVMLHLPMEGERVDETPDDALMADMDRRAFLARLDRDLQAVPEARGVNNHMGSVLTAQEKPMAWLMVALAERDLFFVDSRTTAETLAQKAAIHAGLRQGRRRVFLDNETDAAALERQFHALLTFARQHGQAIAIAHPHPETLAFLEQRLATLNQEGVTLVPVSQLMTRSSPDTL